MKMNKLNELQKEFTKATADRKISILEEILMDTKVSSFVRSEINTHTNGHVGFRFDAEVTAQCAVLEALEAGNAGTLSGLLVYLASEIAATCRRLLTEEERALDAEADAEWDLFRSSMVNVAYA